MHRCNMTDFKMIGLPSIPEFYSGKNVFITGGSGFIGKVLVEKLLRSCPRLKKIYLLMREKKGKSPEERIETMIDLPLFDVQKHQEPEAPKKIRIVHGDVTQLGLGLSPEDTKLLIDEVNIVFHGAASVRFDDSLTDAVILNTRGTREVVNLALEMKKLDVFVHISTTYCNTDRPVIEEEFYPAHADWRKTIEIAENVDRHVLDTLTAKYIDPLPNTYTFAKSLAENVVYDLCNGKIAAVVLRPSIVISTVYEPVQGWIDNFNGPVGLLVACGKGVVRTVYADPDLISDYVPVDVLVRTLIVSSWKQATEKNPEEKLEISFYNCSQNDVNATTTGKLVEMGDTIRDKVPLNDLVWYPNPCVTKYYYYYFITMLFYQLLPAVIIDAALRVIGKKPLLVKIQRRVYVAIMALQYFSFNTWKFINNKTFRLQEELLPCDVDSFSMRVDTVDPYQYFVNATKGCRLYLLKEGADLENARKHSNRMWVLAQIVNFLWDLGLLWLVFVKIDIISMLVQKGQELPLFSPSRLYLIGPCIIIILLLL